MSEDRRSDAPPSAAAPGAEPDGLSRGNRAERLIALWFPRRGKSIQIAFFASVWLGAGGGGLLAFVLWGAVLLVQPQILARGNEAGWLLFDLLLVLSNLGLFLGFLFLWPLLAWLRRRSGGWTEGVQLAAAIVPGTLISLFLADVFGRHLLPRVGGDYWPPSIVAAALAAAAGAALTLSLATLLAVARLRFAGRWRLGRLHRAERWIPLLMNSALALLLLHAGPYPQRRPLPSLDRLSVPMPRPLESTQLVLALGSLPVTELRGGKGPSALSALADSSKHEARSYGQESAPSFWNTIATGFGPGSHGLARLEGVAPRGVSGDLSALEGSPILARLSRHVLSGAGLAEAHATDRRELRRPPFWEIAAHAGRRALVINWWGSYPAVRHPRLHIASDRWMLRLWQGRAWAAADSALRSPEDLAHRLELHGDLLQQVFRYRAHRRSVQAGDSLLARVMLPDVEGRADMADAWSYATTADAFHTLLALQGMASGKFDTVVVMLNGLDILDRRLEAGLDARPGDDELRERSARLHAIYLRYLDELWQELQTHNPGSTTVLAAETRSSDRDRTLWSWRDRELAEWKHEHATPWAAQLLSDLGLPPARDMGCGQFAARGDWPETYGARPDWGMASGRHRVDLERLRSLGYIGR